MKLTHSCKRISSLFHILLVTILLFSLLGWGTGHVSAIRITCYVDADATGTHNGTSWANAYTDLQSGLAELTCNEIWVAAGTYKPGTTRSATFQLEDDVWIFGGFAGTEVLREERKPAVNLTVLSGDIDNNDSQTPVITDLASVTGNTTNSYQVVTGVDGAALDGFTITAGYADGPSGSGDNSGGGMHNNYACPALANLTFSGNHAYDGGGLYIYGNNPTFSPTLTKVSFIANSAEHYGGGMHLANQSSGSPALTEVVFKDNLAGEWGGGLYNGSSNTALTDVVFGNNLAGNGGGMYTNSSTPVLTGVSFTANLVTGYGGGMYNFSSDSKLKNVTFTGNSAVNQTGGGMTIVYSNPTLTNVTFSDNTAAYGGGMQADTSSPALKGVTFSSNVASHWGGGIYSVNGGLALTNVTFSANTAVGFGGGIYLSDQFSYIMALKNVTFSGNSALSGGGIYNNLSSPTINDAIFWGNTATSGGAQIHNNSSTPILNDSVVQGGCPTGSTCTNILTADPLLGTLGSNGGFTQTLPIPAGSPARDAGNDATCADSDQRGLPRPQGSHCDMGAYEYLSTSPAVWGNAGVANAAISYTGGSTTANASGDYMFAVASGWFGTVTPSRVGYTFSPDHREYADVTANQALQDYTATLNTYTISGNAGVADATITYTGGSTTSTAGGGYLFTAPFGWNGTVTPSKPGYTFTPDHRDYTDVTANQALQDYTATLNTYTIFLPLVIR